MMDISHLYHDAAFGDPTLELDVKEQLRTREVNAREERNLQRLHKSYDREKCICEKNTAWERWKVGQSLYGIWEKSPRLEKRLAMEKARIEALERRILYRNFRMNSNIINFSSFSNRSPARVNLQPLQNAKKIEESKNNWRKKEKSPTDNDDKGHLNTSNERGFLRQADFVKRSEHSIKALAKLNWKQQNRQRDHERFKEDLFFHSKRVFDKARVILKGRNDVDVENLYSDLENILNPPAKKLEDLTSTYKQSMKNPVPPISPEKNILQLSVPPISPEKNVLQLSVPPISPEKNILQLSDSYQTQSSSPRLLPVPESNEDVEQDTQKLTLKNSSEDTNTRSVDSVDSKRISKNQENEFVSKTPEVSRNCSLDDHKNGGRSIESSISTKDSGKLKLPPLQQVTNHTSTSDESSTSVTVSSHQQLESNTGSDSNTGMHDIIRNSNSSVKDMSNSNEKHKDHLVPFSPPSSISQVIIEENEEDLENIESASLLKEEYCLDVNNNDIASDKLETGESRDRIIDTSAKDEKENASLYTMTFTTGLPQVWKQNEKPKEKIVVEVSAAAIARKHRRKRKERC